MDATAEGGTGGLLVVELDAGESLLAASGALVDYVGKLRVERAREGVLRSVANARERQRTPIRVTADAATTVRFAPPHHGNVVAADLADDDVAATREAFVAATGDVRVGADRVGDAPARGSGLFLTTVSGGGTAYLAGRGRVERVPLPEGEERVVAAANVVAFDTDAAVSVERVGAIEDAAPVCRIRGPATVWTATRPAPGATN
ncbi:AIM24 family protein [Halobacterium noricense]|uniref:AIM24 family protein n=1 Tax=Halobacterium noricense TaxID=223182 RepID=UPI001E4B5CF3|nr:AIM24 family protein [Halobacterium noricense]UHH25506.1 AIM24 family protein [Halobacterium noricense]